MHLSSRRPRDASTATGIAADDDITLVTNAINSETLSILIEHSGDYIVRTTQTNTIEVGLDIVFPKGLVGFWNW